MPDSPQPTRVVILGGGFGGVWTTVHLERCWRGNPKVEITLISRNNYFLMTPFLFEASSGVLEPRHAVNPIRRLFRQARFIEAEVERIDLAAHVVEVRHEAGQPTCEVPYDHLVLAMGGVTNQRLIPGSEHTLTFKTLGDAIYLRNQTIDLFERASIEPDPVRRRELLTFIVIGAGLVGVELLAELTEFVQNVARLYPVIRREEPGYYLIEAGPAVMPEMERDLAAYAVKTLEARGVHVLTNTKVKAIERGRVQLPDGTTLKAETILLATGIAVNPLLAQLPLKKNPKGRLQVEPTMRVTEDPAVWALGDCAAIPDANGKPYPPLAQHALRQARTLAGNLTAAISGKGTLRPFVYESMGMLAALGHYSGVGRVLRLKLRGFAAWWVWRTYYLFQMPRVERKIRIMMDWTVALFFKYDVVKLDLFGERHPAQDAPKAPPGAPARPEEPAKPEAVSHSPDASA